MTTQRPLYYSDQKNIKFRKYLNLFTRLLLIIEDDDESGGVRDCYYFFLLLQFFKVVALLFTN